MKQFFFSVLALSTFSAFAQQTITNTAKAHPVKSVHPNWCGSHDMGTYKPIFQSRPKNSTPISAGNRAAIQWIPVWYHVIGKNDGTGLPDMKDILDNHCEMNEDFNPFNIGFYIAAIDTIKNTTLWNYQNNFLGWQAFSQYNESNVCNIYVNGNLPGLCGFATFPGTAPAGGGIFLNGDCIGPSQKTIQHEMGHYLGLPHTFESSDGIEFVNGTNCSSAGDFFCDTPADFLDDRTPCPYTGLEQDINGDFYKDVIDETLIMSYFFDECVNRFSTQQENEMVFVLNNDRDNLLNQPLPDLNPLPAPTFVTPVAGDTTIVGNQPTTFRWNKVPGADFYILKVSLTSPIIIYADTLMRDTSFTISGLPSNKTVNFRVRALSLGNTCSNFTPNQQIVTSVIKANASVSAPSCAGETDGSLTLTATSGVAPYSYNWNTGATTASLTNISSGVYTVTITDANGEVAITNVTVPGPAAIDLTINKVGNNLTALVTGGTEPYTYNWSNGVNGPGNNNISFGDYTVTVTDAKGCVAIETFSFSATGINKEQKLSLQVYPNPASAMGGVNVQLTLNESTTATIQLLNTQGQVVSSRNATLQSGSNVINVPAANLPAGVYYLQLSTPETNTTTRVVIQ